MTSASPALPSVPVAILAAGRASRFGGGKLDAACAGKPLGRWVLDAVAAAGAPPGLLIVGPEAPVFAQEAMVDGWTLITNPQPERGLGTSVALAALHADCLRAEGLLLLLADMPLTSAGTIRTMLDHAPSATPIAVRYPSGKAGVPARFPAAMLEELSRLDGDRGAASLMQGRQDIHLIDVPSDTVIDVDDPAALIRAEALLAKVSHLG
ncbi:MAG: NTP transferase domain-containing protein [Sphingobium sp.]